MSTFVLIRAPADRRVFINAMLPVPRETPGAWWANTGAVADVLRGGHLIALAHPDSVADYLLRQR